jgi:hypothetical protein
MRLNNRLPILPSCERICKERRDLSRVAVTENHLGGNPNKGPYIGECEEGCSALEIRPRFGPHRGPKREGNIRNQPKRSALAGTVAPTGLGSMQKQSKAG